MTSARDELNRLTWTGARLDEVLVTYVHRGAPDDVRTVRASDIVALGRSFFELRARGGRSGSIPYHRVRRIATSGGAVLWERPPQGAARAQES